MKRLILSLCLITNAVFGQKSDTTKVVKLENVSIVGVRADSRVPITQKTITTSDLLTNYHGQEVPLLLNQLPSIRANSDGGHDFGYSYFTLRGMDQTRVNITLNGVPLNEPEDFGVYTSNYPSFINSVQSTQVQRGVGSSTNGSSPIAGSINFQSKNGLIKGNTVEFGGGSYNTFRTNASVSSGLLKNNIAYFINIGGLRTDGFRYNSGSRGGSIFGTVGYFGNQRITKLTGFIGSSSNKMAWEGTYDSILNKDYRTNERGVDSSDLFTQYHFQFNNINILGQSKITTTLFYNHLDGKYFVYNRDSIYFARETQYSNWYGIVSQFDYKKNFFKFTTGISANTYTRFHNGYDIFSSFQHDYINQGTKNEVSSFVKTSFDDKGVVFYLDLQLRYAEFIYKTKTYLKQEDDFTGDNNLPKKSWLFFNPKIGGKIFFNNGVTSYYSIGLSHKEPSRSNLFYNGLYLGTLVDLKPETVVDGEWGFEYTGRKVKLQTNVFVMAFRNEIVPTGENPGDNTLPPMQNVDHSIKQGVEFDFSYKYRKISYNINSTYMNSELGDENKHHILNPRLLVKQSLSYERGWTTIGLTHTYSSKSYIDIDNYFSIPGYSVFGANLSQRYKNITLSLQANNILSEKYYTNGYVRSMKRYLFPNALINYNITLRIKI